MDKSKMKRRKKLIAGAAAYVASCMIVLVVRHKLRNRRMPIRYGPIEARDRIRFDYLNNKIWKNDTISVFMIRLKRAPFFKLCEVMRECGLLYDTIHTCIEEQVAFFLHITGHNAKNRVVANNFTRSGESVSRYFGLVLHAIGELRAELIRPSSLETHAKIAGNLRWDSFFTDCIGAIDGTHISASVRKSMEAAFHGRKSHCTQNVMAAVDFDKKFTYLLAGWEGTAHDATVLEDTIERPNGLRIPVGKFYLVDIGYEAKTGFMPPFRGVRYHLNEWGNNPVQSEKELFNFRHSALRMSVECAFGSVKRRFKILDDATPFFPFKTQVDIVIACCIIHNWVISQGNEAIDDFIIPEAALVPNPHRTERQQALDHIAMVNRRQTIANQMWAAHQGH